MAISQWLITIVSISIALSQTVASGIRITDSSATIISTDEAVGMPNTHCPIGRKGFSMNVLPSGRMVVYGGKAKFSDQATSPFFKLLAAASIARSEAAAAVAAGSPNATIQIERLRILNQTFLRKLSAQKFYAEQTRKTYPGLPSTWNGLPSQILDDLWMAPVDGRDRAWKQVLGWQPEGPAQGKTGSIMLNSTLRPAPVWKTASTLYKDTMLMMGGCPCLDQGCSFSNQIWAIGDNGARVLNQSGFKTAVRGAEIAVIGDLLYLVGGKVNRVTCSKSVWVAELGPHDTVSGWEEVPMYPGDCRWGFALEVVKKQGKGQLLMFGGRTENYTDTNFSTNHNYFNDVLTFNPESKEWTNQPKTSPWPTPRNHLGSGVIHNTLYVFGGRTSVAADNIPSDQLWAYSADHNTWHDLKAGRGRQVGEGGHKRPLSRFGHGAGVFGENLIVFGGETIRTKTDKKKHTVYATDIYLNDIWSFNTVTHKWEDRSPQHCQSAHDATTTLATIGMLEGDPEQYAQSEDNFLIVGCAILVMGMMLSGVWLFVKSNLVEQRQPVAPSASTNV